MKNQIIFLLLAIDLSIFNFNIAYAQLADSPWPMFHTDVRHTGLSKYDTSEVDGTLRWTFEAGEGIESSPAIGADGTVYIPTYDKKLYAFGGKTADKKSEQKETTTATETSATETPVQEQIAEKTSAKPVKETTAITPNKEIPSQKIPLAYIIGMTVVTIIAIIIVVLKRQVVKNFFKNRLLPK